MIILCDDDDATPEQSLLFFHANRDQLGEIVDARVVMDDPTEFPMTLRDLVGNKIMLCGCVAGEDNEAGQAALAVLIEAGFPPSESAAVLRQCVWLTKRLPRAVAQAAGLPWQPRNGPFRALWRRAPLPRAEWMGSCDDQ